MNEKQLREVYFLLSLASASLRKAAANALSSSNRDRRQLAKNLEADAEKIEQAFEAIQKADTEGACADPECNYNTHHIMSCIAQDRTVSDG